jgi:branched-subunit amino acid transport protein
MSDLLIVLGMAAITYTSRALFLARPGREPSGRAAAFLDRFPLALFVSLAAAGLLVPDAEVDPALGYIAFGGAVLGGILTRRSLVGVLLIGGGIYWTARLSIG